MPDFERLIDQLSIDLCQTEQQKEVARAYIQGKNHARIEFLILLVVTGLIVASFTFTLALT